jgi:mannose-6-phosphate isomerase
VAVKPEPPVAYPMPLEPRYLEKPWGGRRLERVFGRPLPEGRTIGESWELFDRPAGSNLVGGGPLAGRSIGDLRGERELPLMVKLLDVQDRLSVQVHPDEATARAHGTEPKTEAWVVLEADPGARIWRGLREESDPDAFRAAVEAGTVEGLLHSFEPKAGDAVILKAGTIHAAGGGLLLAEVQQSSETTYRLWDWGRPKGKEKRPLQLDRGLAAARLGPAGPDRIVAKEIEDDGNLRRLLLVATPQFQVEHLTMAGTTSFETPVDGEPCWHALLVIGGTGTIRAFDRRAYAAPFRPGDTLLLPSGHELYEIEPAGGKVVQALAFREG